jgi:hypothetical protein
MTDCAQDRLARLEARTLRLERAVCVLAECAIDGGTTVHSRDVILVLLSAIRRDLAADDKAKGGIR